MMKEHAQGIDSIPEEQLHFVERFGMLFEQAGHPPMLGRVLGWLLICNPPVQTQNEIADALQASMGSISSSLKILTHLLWVQRHRVPGDRRIFFSIPSGIWSNLLRKRMEFVSSLKILAEEGLEISAGESDESKSRLLEMHKVYSFMETELPLMIDQIESELES